MDTKQAIASGLFVVGVTSLVGMASHARAGRVRWRTGLVFGAAGMVGAFIGARIGAHLPGALLLIAFALMMVATAIAMIRGRRADLAADRASLPLFRTITDGALVGLVTGTVGAGGGFLVVPALALLGGLPMPIAIGTSLLVIAMNTMSGFLGYATTISIDWTITLLVTAGAVAGALLGSRLAGRISPELLRRGFGWFVLAMAGVMLVGGDRRDDRGVRRTSAWHAIGTADGRRQPRSRSSCGSILRPKRRAHRVRGRRATARGLHALGGTGGVRTYGEPAARVAVGARILSGLEVRVHLRTGQLAHDGLLHLLEQVVPLGHRPRPGHQDVHRHEALTTGLACLDRVEVDLAGLVRVPDRCAAPP